MLTDDDRARLAAHARILRKATDELTASRRRLAAAEQTLEEVADGDWRERRLGGLFSHDSGRARRFREAARAKKDLTKLIEQQETQTGRLEIALDGLLEPILRSGDKHYRELLMALRRCDLALDACRTVSDSIGRASEAARIVVKALSSNPASSQGQRYDPDVAASRYDENIRHAREALPTLGGAIRKARDGVIAATRIAVDEAPLPQPALLDRLPGGMTTVGDRFRLAEALTPLRKVQAQIDTAAAVVTGWRRSTDKARKSALRAAHELI